MRHCWGAMSICTQIVPNRLLSFPRKRWCMRVCVWVCAYGCVPCVCSPRTCCRLQESATPTRFGCLQAILPRTCPRSHTAACPNRYAGLQTTPPHTCLRSCRSLHQSPPSCRSPTHQNTVSRTRLNRVVGRKMRNLRACAARAMCVMNASISEFG